MRYYIMCVCDLWLSQIAVHVNEEMTEAAERYNETGYEGVTKTWDGVQHDVSVLFCYQ